MSDTSKNHIFTKFKELGLYSCEVPHVLTTNRRGTENLLINAVGKIFFVFGSNKLRKYSTSEKHPADISCLAAGGRYIFTGCQNKVYVFRDKQNIEKCLESDAEIKYILPFFHHVIAIDMKNQLTIWLIETGTQNLKIPFDSKDFEISCLMHPRAYTNKIVLGSTQGKLQLWNVAKNRFLHEFILTVNDGITCIEQSTTVDVVAVGTDSGSVLILNLRTGKILFKLKQDFGSINSITFLQSNLPLLVTGTSLGHLCIWDLDERCLKSVLEDVHKSPVASVTSLPGENVVISNAADNSIKMWIIDENSFTASLLRDRSGHYGSISKVKFYNNEKILSCGYDSTVRLFHTLYDNVNNSFGKAKLTKKKGKGAKIMPHIVDFTFEKAREDHWDGMIAVHRNHIEATTWNIKKSKIGNHKFFYKHPSNDFKIKGKKSDVNVSSVEMTSCGNFSLIGYSNGNIDLYNMQSGIYKGNFVHKTQKGSTLAHQSSVVCIGVDNLNQIVVTLGQDKSVNFWSFKTRFLKSEMKLDSPPTFGKLHRDTSLIAVVLENFTIIVIDLDTQNIIRRFSGHSGKVNDLVWSENAMMLITASSDGYIRVWDLPLSSLIDCFPVDSPVKSLTLSPNSALLATVHVGSPSISVWSNSSLFGISTYEPEFIDEEEEEEFSGRVIFDMGESLEQLEAHLLTKSGLASSRWANLNNIEIIRERSKPKQPVKKITQAPFFLGTNLGEEAPKDEVQKKEVVSFRIFDLSPFARMLETKSHEEMLDHMKSLGPSAIDAGLRTLSANFGGSEELLKKFIIFIKEQMETRKNFELIQAYLQLFLKLHTEEIVKSDDCVSELKDVFALNAVIREEFTDLINECLTLVDFVKNPLL